MTEFQEEQLTAFERESIRMLRLILRNQEIIMADIDTLNSEVAEVAADEATIANDLGTIIKDFQDAEAALAAEQTINLAGPIAALQALHAKLQADDASIVAAEPTPAAPAAPAN